MGSSAAVSPIGAAWSMSAKTIDDREIHTLRDELRTRDETIATLVHELRTPLTAASAYAQLLSRHVLELQRELSRLARLVDDVASRDCGGTVSWQGVDLGREARDAVRRLRLVSGRDADAVDDASTPYVVLGDPARIAQVHDNLLLNAARYSPAGERIAVNLRRQDGEIVLAVTDRGMGIAAEELPRIFERSYRSARARVAEPGGLGIGLSVCRDVVAAHRGRIWATSAGIGKGCSFFVSLPEAAGR